MPTGRYNIDLGKLDPDFNSLNVVEKAKAVNRFRVELAKVIRKEALPDLRKATPKRTGRMRKGWKVSTRKGSVSVVNPARYWHLQQARAGLPMPQFLDRLVLDVVSTFGKELASDVITDVIGERTA